MRPFPLLPWPGLHFALRGRYNVPAISDTARLPVAPRLVVVTHPAGVVLGMDFDGRLVTVGRGH